MELSTAIKHAIDGNALLFLGSGFSVGAKPLKGESFLTGRALAKHLYEECGIKPLNEELNFASQRYRKSFSDEKLVAELTSLFSAESVAEHHKRFADISWKSIYTTNYDNVLERAFAERKKKLLPTTLNEDSHEYTTRKNVVVHINGYIDSLTAEALNDSFKLTNVSYLTESFSKSNWSFLFRRSLETCRAVIFIGYSMYDLDIQRIIYADDKLKEKTIFIEHPEMTAIDIENSIQAEFGSVFPVGIEGFWQEYDRIHGTYIKQDTSSSLFCFEEIAISNATKDFRDDYIFDLFLKGMPDLDFIWNEVHGNGAEKYYIVRGQHGDAIDYISKEIRNVIASSEMANGKTLFIVGLVCELMSKGYRAFWLKDDAEDFISEIDFITSLDVPAVVIIENYPRRLDEIKYLELKRQPNLVLLTSAKSGLHDVYQDDLIEIINPKRTVDFDLNHLSGGELDKLNAILTTYKLWGERDAWREDQKKRYLVEDCDGQLSGVLLEIVKSPSVHERFNSLFGAFREDGALTDILVAASVLKLLGFDSPRESLICELLDSSYLCSLDFKRSSLANELLSLGGGHVIPKSSVLAKHGLTSFSDSRALVDRLVRIATNAHDRGNLSGMYFEIYKSLVTFSTLQSLLPEKGKRDALIRFYEAIKNLSSAQSHPHFWLQYAIARLAYDSTDDLIKAKLYLDTAYAHAGRRLNYHTRHMDSVKARYLIKHSATISEINSAMMEFHEGHSILVRLCRTEQALAPFKVAKNYLTFYNEKKPVLNESHKKILLKSARDILDYSQKLKDSLKRDPSLKFCRKDLESLVADIESGGTQTA